MATSLFVFDPTTGRPKELVAGTGIDLVVGAGTLTVAATGTGTETTWSETATVSFGDAPGVLFTIPTGWLLDRLVIFVETAFDGAGAAIEIGDGATVDLYLGAAESDLTEAGNSFEKEFLREATALHYTVTPGAGASQGRLVIEVKAVKSSTVPPPIS